MVRTVMLGIAMVMAGTPATAQQRLPSPDGHAATEIGGRYVGTGGSAYVDGQWIEISYGRPIKRGRDLWGSPTTYGQWLNRGAPVWRAGADISTYLVTEVPLVINDTSIEPGGYTLFIVLEPDDWTLIVSEWQPQRQYDPSNHKQLWGSYGYTSDKDVVRVSMALSPLPFSVDQLTWSFLDMSAAGGKLAIAWDTTMAAVPFAVGAAQR
jgi:hypothetical protein